MLASLWGPNWELTEVICGLRPSQFVVAECHNIFKSHLPYGRCSYNLIYYQGTSNNVVLSRCIGYVSILKLPKLDWVYLHKINWPRPLVATVRCAESYNIWDVTDRLFMAWDHYSLLWLKATSFLESQRGYSCMEDTTVHCNQRPPQLKWQDPIIWTLYVPAPSNTHTETLH